MISLTAMERHLLLLSAGLATFMIVLDYSIANISIPYIAGDLGVSNDQGTYVITSFAVGNAIGLAATGWLTKRIGPIRLIILSILLFTLFSWTCGMSINLTTLVLSRFIQGLVAGPVIPLSQSLIVTFATPQSRSRDIAIWTTIIIVAPVVGPILGGYISDWYFWTWIFYINIPIGILCALVLWLVMRKHEMGREKTPIDVAGVVLLSIGVACLQILLDKGQQWDWWNSYLIRALTIGSIVSFTFLAIREVWHKNPFLNVRLLSIPSYSVSIVCLIVSYAIYFGTIVIVPLWLQEYMNYHVEWAGVAVSAFGVPPIFLGMLSPLDDEKNRHRLHACGRLPFIWRRLFLFGFLHHRRGHPTCCLWTVSIRIRIYLLFQPAGQYEHPRYPDAAASECDGDVPFRPGDDRRCRDFDLHHVLDPPDDFLPSAHRGAPYPFQPLYPSGERPPIAPDPQRFDGPAGSHARHQRRLLYDGMALHGLDRPPYALAFLERKRH